MDLKDLKRLTKQMEENKDCKCKGVNCPHFFEDSALCKGCDY